MRYLTALAVVKTPIYTRTYTHVQYLQCIISAQTCLIQLFCSLERLLLLRVLQLLLLLVNLQPEVYTKRFFDDILSLRAEWCPLTPEGYVTHLLMVIETRTFDTRSSWPTALLIELCQCDTMLYLLLGVFGRNDHTHTYTHTHIHTYAHTHTHTHIHTYIHKLARSQKLGVCVYVCVRARVCACMLSLCMIMTVIMIIIMMMMMITTSCHLTMS